MWEKSECGCDYRGCGHRGRRVNVGVTTGGVDREGGE